MPAFWHIAEYARILNMSDDISDVVHSIRSLYKLLISYRDRNIQNIVKHLKRSVLQKKKDRTKNQGTSTNVSSKTQEKEVSQENILEFFLLLLKLHF